MFVYIQLLSTCGFEGSYFTSAIGNVYIHFFICFLTDGGEVEGGGGVEAATVLTSLPVTIRNRIIPFFLI